MRKSIWLIALCILLALVRLEPAYALEPTAPPTPPTGVTVSGVKDTTACIAWDPVPYATQYSVYVNGIRRMGSVGPGLELTGLQPDTEYSVYVTAANDLGESGPSGTVSFRTLPPAPTAPNAPVVSKVTGSSALVTWEPLPAYEQIKVYRLYVDGQPVADVQPQAGSLQAADLQNLAEGTHTVAVAGVNDYREGPQSSPAKFTISTIPAPSGLRLYNHSVDTLYLMWDAAEGASKYRVLVNGKVAGETMENTFAVRGLQPAQTYQVALAALYPDGNVSETAVLEASTAPAASEISIQSLFTSISPYVSELTPGLTILFGIGGAFLAARALSKILQEGRYRAI